LVGLAGCGGRQETSRPVGDPLKDIPARVLYEGGLAFAANQDNVRAEQYLVAAMVKGYPEAEVMPALLRACVEGSRLRAALRHGEPYLSRHPNDWRLRFLVANIYLGLGEVGRARIHLERTLAQAPEFAETEFLLGQLAELELDLPRAKQKFARYLALAPDGPHAEEAREGMSRQPARVINRSAAKRGRP
jgi:tetratricopeptide (TPR) repeat protein